MTTPINSSTSSDTAHRVRRITGSAALAAVCLIYCGFFYLGEPAGSDLFAISAFVFFHTLRIGGILMAIIALASLAGHKAVLLFVGHGSPGHFKSCGADRRTRKSLGRFWHRMR